jgi:hypothetical protein
VAEDFRINDPSGDALTLTREALIRECQDEKENCLFTSTSFFIWLRWLKTARALLWAGGAIGSLIAASHILNGDNEHRFVIALAALAGVLLPGLVKALRLDRSIRDYTKAAGTFKDLQGEFRRLASVWSHKELPQFEQEARRVFIAMNEARKPSLTPPEICFRLARQKIRKGHYTPDSAVASPAE